MTQNKQILEYMKSNKGITSFEAFSKFRITRLSGRIHELRQSGHRIGMTWEEAENGSRYGRYYLQND